MCATDCPYATILVLQPTGCICDCGDLKRQHCSYRWNFGFPSLNAWQKQSAYYWSWAVIGSQHQSFCRREQLSLSCEDTWPGFACSSVWTKSSHLSSSGLVPPSSPVVSLPMSSVDWWPLISVPSVLQICKEKLGS